MDYKKQTVSVGIDEEAYRQALEEAMKRRQQGMSMYAEEDQGKVPYDQDLVNQQELLEEFDKYGVQENHPYNPTHGLLEGPVKFRFSGEKRFIDQNESPYTAKSRKK